MVDGISKLTERDKIVGAVFVVVAQAVQIALLGWASASLCPLLLFP